MSKKTRKMAALAAILSLALLAGAFAGLAEENDGGAPTPEPTAEPVPTLRVERDPEHITVANTTSMSGDFFAGLWGSGTADADVRALIHGYDLVRWNGEDGAFELDPSVVSGIAVLDDAEGNRTYTLALYDDLFFSDGTPVTAWDYAFSVLLMASGELGRLGLEAREREYLLGFDEYARDAMPLQNTELARVDSAWRILDGEAQDSRLAERVLRVEVPAEDGGAPRFEDFSALVEALSPEGELALVRGKDGSLALPGAGLEAGDGEWVRVSPEGVILDWRYEDGARVFSNGEHPHLSGLRVVADDELQFTVSHEYLPFFYELNLLSCVPYPIGTIAPGVEVRDDGDGVYLANAAVPAEGEGPDGDAPVFTPALLERTILDPEEGYLRHPQVVSGPYVLTDFDGVTAEFERNPLYKGDVEGRLPDIQRLTFTLAENDTMVEKLATGEYDLLNKVTQADTVSAAMDLMRGGEFTRTAATLPELADAGEDSALWKSENGYRMSNYPRTGLSFICFRCERPAVSSAAVRQAIAWCMDRDAITRDYTGGYGMRTDSFNGMGQWMMGFVTGTLVPPVEDPEDPDDPDQAAAYDAEMAEWEALNLEGLTPYALDLEKAKALLASEGWSSGESGVLEKDGEPLDLVLIYPEGNAIHETLEENMVKNLAEAGVKLTLVPVPMDALLSRYYRRDDAPVALPDGTLREVDMIYLATNFDVVFDPADSFAVDENGVGLGSSGLADGELYRLALEMRHTEARDRLSYMKTWIAFEERFNALLPMIPLYTNVYFDFYAEELRDYDIDKSATWSEAIIGAYVGEERQPTADVDAEPEASEAPGSDGDDFEIID